MNTIVTMDSMADTTTISVSKKTRNQLAKFGSKDETFDDVIQRLLEEAGWREQEARWNRMLKDETFVPLDNT